MFVCLLCLDFLQVSILNILLGSFNGFISGVSILISSSLDLLETHTDDSLLYSRCLSSSLLLYLLNSDFLVLSSPCLSPCELDWLDILMIKRSYFGA